MIRTSALLCLLAGSAVSAADMSVEERLSLACMAWTVDRFLLDTVEQKHEDMAEVLDGTGDSNLVKPVAIQLAKNLRSMNTHTNGATDKTQKVYDAACEDVGQ